MTTKSLGEILKAAREAKNLNLRQLSDLTHVPLQVLTDLEHNDFALLPPAVFVQGYVVSCARVLGFDARPVLALLRRDYKEDETGFLLPVSLTQPMRRRQFRPGPRFWVSTLVILIAVVASSYIGFQYWRLSRPPELTIDEPVQNAAVAGNVVVRGRTDPEAVVNVNAQSISIEPDGTFATEVNFPVPGVGFIEVQATNRRGKTNSLLRSVSVAF